MCSLAQLGAWQCQAASPFLCKHSRHKLWESAEGAELSVQCSAGTGRSLHPHARNFSPTPTHFFSGGGLVLPDTFTLPQGCRRVDGRGVDELRPIGCEAGPLPRTVHGSGLFTRGETQSLATATVGHDTEVAPVSGTRVLLVCLSGSTGFRPFVGLTHAVVLCLEMGNLPRYTILSALCTHALRSAHLWGVGLDLQCQCRMRVTPHMHLPFSLPARGQVQGSRGSGC